MSEPKTYTELEMVLAKRAAFARGAEAVAWRSGPMPLPDQEAAKIYPLPMIARPRELDDPHELGIAWRVRSGEWGELIEMKNMGTWRAETSGRGPTRQRVALWNDLLACPNEMVEDVGP